MTDSAQIVEIRTDWPDVRVNDLAALVKVNDKRIDTNERRLDAMEAMVTEMKTNRIRRLDNSRAIILILITVLLSEVAQITIKLATG